MMQNRHLINREKLSGAFVFPVSLMKLIFVIWIVINACMIESASGMVLHDCAHTTYMVSPGHIKDVADKLLPGVPEFGAELAAILGDQPTTPLAFFLLAKYLHSKWTIATERYLGTRDFFVEAGAIPRKMLSLDARLRMLGVDVIQLAEALYNDELFTDCIRDYTLLSPIK